MGFGPRPKKGLQRQYDPERGPSVHVSAKVGSVTIGSLFSGIGGLELGLERAGMETIAFCEIDPFCRKVLKKHWPDVPIYTDVRELTNEQLESDGLFPDIITGGFPCQDISTAGRQVGIAGERSGLWSECARLLGDIRPAYAIFENVTALLSGDYGRWFGKVLGDLAEIGYDAEWHCIPASELGAHHHRDRIWIIAYPNSDRKSNSGQGQALSDSNGISSSQKQERHNKQYGFNSDNYVADTNDQRPQGRFGKFLQERTSQRVIGQNGGAGNGWWSVEPSVRGMVDGISTGFHGYRGRVATGVPNRVNRLKGLGNAIVPAVAEVIFRAIEDVQKMQPGQTFRRCMPYPKQKASIG